MDAEPAAKEPEPEEKPARKKGRRKRSRSDSGSSSSSSSYSSSSDSEDEKEKEKKDKQVDEEKKEEEAAKSPESVEEEKEPEKEADNNGHKSGDEEEAAKKDEAEPKKMETDEAITENNKESDEPEKETDKGGEPANEETNEEKNESEKTETIDLLKDTTVETSPRALHRTSSIFLRNLAPSITKAEVDAMCKRYNGFLRVAIADPLLERRWFRRGWVTFRRDVNIKEICWNLNNIRLRDCELRAIVNKDRSRRVRPVNGLTCHKTIVRSDIKLCAKIGHNLVDKVGLWKDQEDNGEKNGESFGLQSKNPVLQNITDYLIEEASAEEDELLGLTAEAAKKTNDGEGLDACKEEDGREK